MLEENSSIEHFCLICSILNRLNEKNCCWKHLNLVETRRWKTKTKRKQTCQSLFPCIRLKRIVYVKDDDEKTSSIEHQNQLTLNMAQATEQILTKMRLEPKIILKRVEFERL